MARLACALPPLYSQSLIALVVFFSVVVQLAALPVFWIAEG